MRDPNPQSPACVRHVLFLIDEALATSDFKKQALKPHGHFGRVDPAFLGGKLGNDVEKFPGLQMPHQNFAKVQREAFLTLGM